MRGASPLPDLAVMALEPFQSLFDSVTRWRGLSCPRIEPSIPAINDSAQPAAIIIDLAALAFFISAECVGQPITGEDLQRLGTLRETNIRRFIHEHGGINLISHFAAVLEDQLRNRFVGFWIDHEVIAD